jgi:hypothetical protein
MTVKKFIVGGLAALTLSVSACGSSHSTNYSDQFSTIQSAYGQAQGKATDRAGAAVAILGFAADLQKAHWPDYARDDMSSLVGALRDEAAAMAAAEGTPVGTIPDGFQQVAGIVLADEQTVISDLGNHVN